jgi:hypothetical protein
MRPEYAYSNSISMAAVTWLNMICGRFLQGRRSTTLFIVMAENKKESVYLNYFGQITVRIGQRSIKNYS